MDCEKKNGVRLLEEIGSGAFGKVLKCVYNGKTHVVKKVAVGKDLLTFKAVNAEFMILSQVKHPRIVKLIKFYQSKVDWNFVLEYMKNGSLRHMLIKFKKNQWKFGQADLLALFMDAVSGVKYLHSKGIIHRDLKPENILVDENHRLKIADFGISKFILDSKADYHTAIGTMFYMAPEVYLLRPYDKSVDTWALGVILYEMAMMQYPFTPADKARIMNPQLAFVPPKIDYCRRNYDVQVQDLLEEMVQRNPKKRSELSQICKVSIVSKIFEKLSKEEVEYNK